MAPPAAKKLMGLTTGLPWFTTVHDRYYEDGLWFSFPFQTVPLVILWVCRNITYWLHSDSWKFGPVGRDGKMRPLYAVGKE